MSATLNNPRVTARQDGGFTVIRDTGVVEVLHSETFGWMICAGPNLDFVPTSGGGFAIKFPSAESAIEAALR